MGIKVSELAQELAQGLSEYSQEVADAIKKATDEVAEEAVQELKSTSPVLTGSYAKGWAKKNTYESKSSKRNTVYNKTDYQLTHLLEKGHVGRDGRRVKAIEHIRPVEEKAAAVVQEFKRHAERNDCKDWRGSGSDWAGFNYFREAIFGSIEGERGIFQNIGRIQGRRNSRERLVGYFIGEPDRGRCGGRGGACGRLYIDV